MKTEQYKQEFIEFMVESDVLKFGDFTLKSGRKSPFFMNELQEFREMHEAVFKSFSAVQQIINPVLEELNKSGYYGSIGEKFDVYF